MGSKDRKSSGDKRHGSAALHSTKEFGRVQLIGLVVCLSSGAGAVAVVALAASRNWVEIVGMLALFALAALAAGTFFGFLFGVPRTGSIESTERYRANTNVEKISDWLTTALVGATLVQLGTIRDGLGVLFDSVAEQLGTGVGPVVPGSIAVYFAIVGFFLGWLVTRLYLARAMNDADTLASIREKVDDLEVQAQEAEQQGRGEQAAELRAEQAGLMSTLRSLGDEYTSIRATVAPGDARTAKMSAIVKQMRASATDPGWDPAAVSALYARGEDGRIQALALIQGKPDLAVPGLLESSISDSKSAFEQHSALTAVDRAVGELAADAKSSIAAAIRAQMEPGGYITPDSDRFPLALRVLKRLDE